MGFGWFDSKVWKANDLKFYEYDGDWIFLFKMIMSKKRGIDYFPRGINEILSEHKLVPFMGIEKNLMLVYDRDFRFYFGKSGAQYKNIVEAALKQAKKSGLMDKLINKYWGHVFDDLAVDKRIEIKLKTPK